VLRLPRRPFAPAVYPVERPLEALQNQLNALHDEVNLLRKRDETLNFLHAPPRRGDAPGRAVAAGFSAQESAADRGACTFTRSSRPAGYVSGDLYDVMRLDEKHVGFYMADAVGHGMPAALLTMFMKNRAGHQADPPRTAIDCSRPARRWPG
jgi:serine phosphatase RsbU (regulator of sigma subunit)